MKVKKWISAQFRERLFVSVLLGRRPRLSSARHLECEPESTWREHMVTAFVTAFRFWSFIIMKVVFCRLQPEDMRCRRSF